MGSHNTRERFYMSDRLHIEPSPCVTATVLATLGLMCLRVWLQMCLYDAYVSSDAGIVTIASNLAYSIVLAIGAAVFLRVERAHGDGGFVLLREHKSPVPVCSARAEQAIPWVAFVLMTLAAVALLIAQVISTDGAILATSIMAGIAAPFGGAMWVLIYRQFDLRRLLIAGFAALGLGSLVGFCLSFLPVITRLAIATMMPVCMLLCQLRISSMAYDYNAVEPERWFDGEPTSTPIILLGGVALLALALGVERGLPDNAMVILSPSARALHQLGVLAISGLLVWLCGPHSRRVSASALLGADIALIAIGVLMTSTLQGQALQYAVAITNLGDTLSLGILWVLAIDYARHSSVHALAVVGATWFFRIFARDIGRIAVSAGGVAATMEVDLIIGVMMLVLAFAAAILLSGIVPRGHRLLEPELTGKNVATIATDEVAGLNTTEEDIARTNTEPAPVAIDPIIARTKALQDGYGLTEREASVCALIASGRNKTAVASWLGISENTVRTHSKNAYAKLGIHSKEELVELLERLED